MEAKRAKEAEKQAKKQATIAAREKAEQEAVETKRAKEAEKQAKKQAVIAAREKAKQEAVEAKRAKEAEKQAKKQAAIAAREKAKQEAVEQASKEAARVLLSQIDSEQTKHIEECLKELESTHEELRIGKIGTEEALQRLRDISERIPK